MKTTVSAPDIPFPSAIDDAQLASWFVTTVYTQLREFTDSLEEDEFIRTYIVLANGERIWPNMVVYHNPDAIKVIGTDDTGVVTRLITHKSNAQFVMKKYKREEGEEEAEDQQQGRKIGFHTARGEYST